MFAGFSLQRPIRELRTAFGRLDFSLVGTTSKQESINRASKHRPFVAVGSSHLWQCFHKQSYLPIANSRLLEVQLTPATSFSTGRRENNCYIRCAGDYAIRPMLQVG
jgi:hypothetical protein